MNRRGVVPKFNPEQKAQTPHADDLRNFSQAIAQYASTVRTFSSIPSFSIASSVAVTAAMAIILRPKVVPDRSL